MTELRTDRLLMRRWRDADRAPFAAVNADPEVMEFMGPRLPPAASDAFVDRIEAAFDARGWGLWALESTASGAFLGYTGLWPWGTESGLPFAPAVEVGWRLRRSAWGHGYASEAGRAALDHAFATLGLDEVVSMTAVENQRSRRVMERLGMSRDPADDFAHPRLAPEDPLTPHVLYRMGRR